MAHAMLAVTLLISNAAADCQSLDDENGAADLLSTDADNSRTCCSTLTRAPVLDLCWGKP